MKPAEFEALKTRHLGVAGVSIVDPHVEEETPNIDPTGQPIKSKKPNPTPRYHYVFGDGTELEAITRTNGDIDVADPGTAMKPDPTAAARTPAQAETERHNKATEAAAATTAARADRAGVRAERREDRQITAQEAQQRAAALREDRANAIATRRLTLDEADREYDRRYRDEVETPLKRAAEQRAVEASRRAEEAAKLEREKFRAEQVTSREREETRRREAGATFAYGAGQDAVSNALKLLPYQANPAFAAQFAAGLNTLSSGGGPISFSPDAFTIDLPDMNALAEQGAARAAAMFSGQGAGGGMPAPGQSPVAPVAPPAQPPTDPLAGVAMAPRTPATTDQWWRR